jgi:hypothetical protein
MLERHFLLSFSQKAADLLLWRNPAVQSQKWDVMGSDMPTAVG